MHMDFIRGSEEKQPKKTMQRHLRCVPTQDYFPSQQRGPWVITSTQRMFFSIYHHRLVGAKGYADKPKCVGNRDKCQ